MIDPEVRQLIDSKMQEIAQLKQELAKLRSDFDGLTICGTGFSGSGKGIMFDENQLQLEKGPKGDPGPKGDKGRDGDPGTISVTAVCNGDGTIDITATGS